MTQRLPGIEFLETGLDLLKLPTLRLDVGGYGLSGKKRFCAL